MVDARSTAAFDATDLGRLERFFEDLPGPVDHVMLTSATYDIDEGQQLLSNRGGTR